MKKLTIYEINDGLDGVIAAKSLKQAIKKLAPFYGYPVKEMLGSIVNPDKYGDDWILTYKHKAIKKGRCKKTHVLGFCDW